MRPDILHLMCGFVMSAFVKCKTCKENIQENGRNGEKESGIQRNKKTAHTQQEE